MANINKRLQELFDVFCGTRCKYRRGATCKETLKKATLIDCPMGEWWDLNDWVNKISETLNLIKQQYDKKHVVKEKGSVKGLKDQ